jgi:hypothetical protein
VSEQDFKLLGGRFSENNLPPEYKHLTRYFQSKLSRTFLFYYFDFWPLAQFKTIQFFCDNFIDHTGYCCSASRLRFLIDKLQLLMKVTDKAKEDLNFALLDKIVSGKFRPSYIDFKNKRDILRKS